jgi:imidazole glycerol-phosphate synthase subunit HisH
MICIVDYDAGNLRSVQKAVEYLGVQATVSSKASDIQRADKIIFPGVGAFGNAMESLNRLKLVTPIVSAIQQGKCFLGICLGMQLLFQMSEENIGVTGLSVLQGRVKRFPMHLKVPHLGWNELVQSSTSPLWKDVPENSYFYFAHSYYVVPEDTSIITGVSDYSMTFPVAIQKGNLFGLQFHPEKSQHVGLQVLNNYLNYKD